MKQKKTKNYLKSISLSFGYLVLGNTAIDHIPSELVRILPIVNQTAQKDIIFNKSIPNSQERDQETHLTTSIGTWMLHLSAIFCIASSSATKAFLWERAQKNHPRQKGKKKKTLGSEAPLQGGEGEREGGNKEEEGSQSLEKRELRGDAEGRDGEVELVEEAEGLVNGVDDLGQVLLRLLGRVGGGADGRGGGRVGGGAGGGGGPGGGEAAVTGGGGRILRGGIHRVESRRDREGNYRESPALL